MGECADDAVFGDMDDEFRIDDDIDFDRYHDDQRSRQPKVRKVMDKQPEALRLAQWLDGSDDAMYSAAAELRRLHTQNQELVKALEKIVSTIPAFSEGFFYVEHHDTVGNFIGTERIDPTVLVQELDSIANSAIAKHKEQE